MLYTYRCYYRITNWCVFFVFSDSLTDVYKCWNCRRIFTAWHKEVFPEKCSSRHTSVIVSNSSVVIGISVYGFDNEITKLHYLTTKYIHSHLQTENTIHCLDDACTHWRGRRPGFPVIQSSCHACIYSGNVCWDGATEADERVNGDIKCRMAGAEVTAAMQINKTINNNICHN